MAIFQPSNIVPSQFSGGRQGVVSAADPVKISWQVNGNSQMTGFRVKILQNNAQSTLVWDSGNLTDGCPFSGTDNQGNVVSFLFQPKTIWSFIGVENGQTYKLNITQYWGANFTNPVQMYSDAVFIAREAPTLVITNFEPELQNVSKTFNATYQQAQNDAISWCRWQLARIDRQGSPSVIEDTGTISTSVLTYQYDGFLTGYTYSINCTVETQNGVQVSTGWMEFSVSYEEAETDDNLEVCRLDDSSVLVDIGPQNSFQGVASPEENYGTYQNGALALDLGSSVTWDSSAGISIPAPWSIGWKGDITGMKLTTQIENVSGVSAVSASKDNSYLLAAFRVQSKLRVVCYRITQNGLEYSSDLDLTPDGFPTNVYDIAWSPSGNLAIISGDGGCVYYQMSNGTGTFVGALSGPSMTPEETKFNCARFSPSGSNVCFATSAGTFLGTVSGTQIDFGIEMMLEGASDFFNSSYVLYPFETLIIVGSYEEPWLATAFSVINGTPSFLSKIYTDIEGETGASCTCTQMEVIGRMANNFVMISGTTSTAADPNEETVVLLYQITEQQTFVPVSHPSSFGSVFRFDEIRSLYTSDADDPTLLNYYEVTFGSGTISFEYEFSISMPSAFGNIELYDEGNYTNLLQFDIYGIAVGGASFLYGYSLYPYTNLLSVGFSDNNDLSINRNLSRMFSVGETALSFSIKTTGSQAVVSITPTQIKIWFFNKNALVDTFTQDLTYTQAGITSLQLFGWQTVDWLCVMNGDYDFSQNNYTPTFSENTRFLTTFENDTLFAGSTNDIYLQNFVYRLNNQILQKIANLPSNITQIRDFGVKSNQTYQYELVRMDANGEYYAPVSSQSVSPRMNAYYLIEATRDPQTENLYHALNVWKFGNNISAGSVSNNNAPTWLTNFTPYRFRQTTSRAGKSGTLQALLSNYDSLAFGYKDTAEMQEKLYAASLSQNVFFLKDMKGNLYMVHISAPIVQTINIKSTVQQVTVSVPWEEIGDASSASVIQFPTDPGWIFNMVFDVQLDVDLQTGELIATYPTPYKGSLFYLVGNELIVKTGAGVPTATFTLTDGSVIVSQ